MKFVITAGPTREYLDPVRFLSNPSTGRMGFALAQAAVRRGHEVTLVTGPVTLKTPRGARRVDVVSACEMLTAVRQLAEGGEADVIISSAAIADWRPARCAAKKLKKGAMSGILRLVRNPDMLKTLNDLRRRGDLPRTLRLVGFAAETGDPRAEAVRKCRAKGLAFIVANDVTRPGCGFGTTTNRVMLIRPEGTCTPLPLMSKLAVAQRIIRACEA